MPVERKMLLAHFCKLYVSGMKHTSVHGCIHSVFAKVSQQHFLSGIQIIFMIFYILLINSAANKIIRLQNNHIKNIARNAG